MGVVVPEAFRKQPDSLESRATAEKFKEQGDEATEAKEYLTAVDLYTKALGLGGSSAVWLCDRSAAYAQLGMHEDALADALIARELDGGLAKAWARAGAAFMCKGYFESAVKAYETAIQLAGSDVDSATGQGLEQAKAKDQQWLDELRDKSTTAKRKYEMRRDLKDEEWDPSIYGFRFHSLVHERQVDGLIYFAEQLRWPYVNEVRHIAEDAYGLIRSGAGASTNIVLVDWLYGLTLPGEHFAFKVMKALLFCTPTLHSVAQQYGFIDSNVVLEKQSYWRVRSVLGRVLGPLPGVRSIGGWIGPAPAVKISGNNEGTFQPLLVRIKARHSSPLKLSTVNDDTIYLGGRSSRYEHTRPTAEDETWAAYLADMTSEDAYIVPQAPTKSLADVTLKDVALQRLPSQTGVTTREDEPEAEYRASISFLVDGRNDPITYTLYTNPIFVTLPHCYGGPHAVHRRELHRYQMIPWEAERLEHHVPDPVEEDDGTCMLINASGKGAEVLARAWCSERGKHAVVVRDSSPCLICAIRGAESIDISVVIWLG